MRKGFNAPDKDVQWTGTGRKAQHPPDRRFPHGVEIRTNSPGRPYCVVFPPYPAKEIGTWTISCQKCGLVIVVTAAGRPDDPNTVYLGCKDS